MKKEKRERSFTIREEFQLLHEPCSWKAPSTLHRIPSIYLEIHPKKQSWILLGNYAWSNGITLVPLKVAQGVLPIFSQTEINQKTPTATWATSSSAILATISAVLWSPKPTNFWTSLGPASSPLASWNILWQVTWLCHKLNTVSQLQSWLYQQVLDRNNMNTANHLNQRNHSKASRDVPGRFLALSPQQIMSRHIPVAVGWNTEYYQDEKQWNLLVPSRHN